MTAFFLCICRRALVSNPRILYAREPQIASPNVDNMALEPRLSLKAGNRPAGQTRSSGNLVDVQSAPLLFSEVAKNAARGSCVVPSLTQKRFPLLGSLCKDAKPQSRNSHRDNQPTWLCKGQQSILFSNEVYGSIPRRVRYINEQGLLEEHLAQVLG